MPHSFLVDCNSLLLFYFNYLICPPWHIVIIFSLLYHNLCSLPPHLTVSHVQWTIYKKNTYCWHEILYLFTRTINEILYYVFYWQLQTEKKQKSIWKWRVSNRRSCRSSPIYTALIEKCCLYETITDDCIYNFCSIVIVFLQVRTVWYNFLYNLWIRSQK